MIFNSFNITTIFYYILFFIPSLVIHEFAHGYIANKLGDPTAKLMGRLTLNPLAHLDPIGTLAIFLIGFGWAKPVPVNPLLFKNPRRDMALVSLAGPGANFLMALIGILLTYFVPYSSFFPTFALINIILGVFNLIPLGPLDGFKIVGGLLPASLASQWEQSYQLTYILLFIVLILPINGQTIISHLISAVSNFLFSFIT